MWSYSPFLLSRGLCVIWAASGHCGFEFWGGGVFFSPSQIGAAGFQIEGKKGLMSNGIRYMALVSRRYIQTRERRPYTWLTRVGYQIASAASSI